MSTVGRVVAVFDLDGTITRRDTLFPYVWRYLARRPWRLARLLAVVPALLAYLFAGRDRGRLKAALLRHTLRGETRAAIEAWNAAYLPRVIARDLLPGAVAALARERQRGATLVLMSASVDLYVPALGKLLGFDHVVCTGVRWEDGVLDGALATPNRRGEEKARCLERLRADLAPVASITAYGNGSSDLPHMRLAERGVLVNGPRRARAEAAVLGIECVDWRGT
ncbi:MAG TPA: HAD-IB family hydrolase [Steroidobacteraceae bacterium]|nr:HAD-IB family hydrolase [Steroidobacteraceae bacterium]HNS27920.1 HAD-IB family hydrolase [Steroidobacteraceae bacterium]